jgi:hypothetical protein
VHFVSTPNPLHTAWEEGYQAARDRLDQDNPYPEFIYNKPPATLPLMSAVEAGTALCLIAEFNNAPYVKVIFGDPGDAQIWLECWMQEREGPGSAGQGRTLEAAIEQALTAVADMRTRRVEQSRAAVERELLSLDEVRAMLGRVKP